MLSKLALIWSFGSHFPASTSSPRRSRIARSYSGRLSRWKVRPPGFGFSTAARSTMSSSVSTSSSSSSSGGRRTPGGGIMPARSLRIIFSAVSASVSATSTSKDSRVRLPASRRLLWQLVQTPWTMSFGPAPTRNAEAWRKPAAEPTPGRSAAHARATAEPEAAVTEADAASWAGRPAGVARASANAAPTMRGATFAYAAFAGISGRSFGPCIKRMYPRNRLSPNRVVSQGSEQARKRVSGS